MFVLSQNAYSGRHFQPSIMFVGKARSCSRVEHLKVASLRQGPYSKTLDQAGRACQGKQSCLLREFVNYGCKKFYTQSMGNLFNFTNGLNKLECYITICWKLLPGTNTLPYWAHLKVSKKFKSFEYGHCSLYYKHIKIL